MYHQGLPGEGYWEKSNSFWGGKFNLTFVLVSYIIQLKKIELYLTVRSTVQISFQVLDTMFHGLFV